MGLGAKGWALPTYSDAEGGGPQSQARTHRSAPRGPSHLLHLQPGAAWRRESVLAVGQAARKSPLSPTSTPPGRELLAVGYSSSVTFRESEVRTSSGRVSSSQSRPCGPAPPRPARPASRPRPSQQLPGRTASGPAFRLRLLLPG